MNAQVLKGGALLILLLTLFSSWGLLQEKVSPKACDAAISALASYQIDHPEEHPHFLAVVDYSKPSYLKRMVLIDLKTKERSFYRVSHGIHSGDLYARQFSNTINSNMSSLGLFKILNIYTGDHGKALRLGGLDITLNSNASKRDIVLHSAQYVSWGFILMNLVTFNGPMIGRSNGCFVISSHDLEDVIQKLNKGAFLYAWTDQP